MKKCTKCKIEKPFAEFSKSKRKKDGFNIWCKPCYKEHYQDNKERKKEWAKEHYQANKERKKEYYQANKERIKEYKKEYHQANKERIKEYGKEYREANKERINEYNKANKERINEYHIERRKTDPLFKMIGNLRSRTSQAFLRKKYSKNTKTQKMLGASWEVVQQHIENQFTNGMNWDNCGEWHIDHIVPLNLSETEEELILLCNYTNLQPLWAEDNKIKGSRFIKKENLNKVIQNHPQPNLIKEIVDRSGTEIIA